MIENNVIIRIKGRRAYVEFPDKYENHRGEIIEFLSHYVNNIEWRITGIKKKKESKIKDDNSH